MSFTLQVDAVRWRAGTDSVRDALRAAVRGGSADPQLGDVVPVVKGNGYGLGNERLARESVRLGVAAVAVGSVHELDAVLAAYPGDVLVLTPYEPADVTAAAAWQTALGAPAGGRVIRTLAAATALHAAIATAGPGRPVRAVLEGLTSTGRFGVAPAGLRAMLAGPEVRGALDDGALRIEGLALHLPLAQPATDHRAVPGAAWHDATVDPAWPAGTTGRVREVLAWQRGWQQLLGDVQAGGDGGADVPGGRRTALAAAPALWLSHLSDAELAVVRGAVPGVPLQVRVGTRLWLGDRQALVPQGTVLAVHELQRGDRSGYRQRRCRPRRCPGRGERWYGARGGAAGADPRGVGPPARRGCRHGSPRGRRSVALAVLGGRATALVRRAPAHAGLARPAARRRAGAGRR